MYNLGEQFSIDLNNLKSNPGAIIKGDKYRFTILTERLIRLEYSNDAKFDDRASELVLCRNFDVPQYDIRQDEMLLEISTKYFTLTYVKNAPFKGSGMNAMKNLRVALNGTNNVWYYGHPEARNYFGSNISVETKDETYINRGLYSLEGFVSLNDSNNFRFNQFGMIESPIPNNIDIYLFMYDKDFGYCLQDYFKLTGNPSMIPRYALGNWWSRETAYNANDVEKLVTNFKDEGIPISVLLLDKGWHKQTDPSNITGFTFNNDLFPSPKELIDKLHMQGIRVGLNVDPTNGINPNEALYQEAIKDITPNEKGIIEFNPFNPKFLDVYFKIFIKSLEDYGVDFFWNDYSNLSDLQKLWVMNHYHYFDLEKNKAKRGMILARNPLVASHRYPVLYSGKTKVGWDSFRQLPFFNIKSANIGVCWWSHNIGGFSGGIEEEDLYIRSIQLGVFSPILRFYSKDGKFYKREPWKWNYKTRNIAAKYLKLRHRLISYLYSEAFRYYRDGKIVFQPLYYLVPKLYDDVLYRNEYFFGNELLVAPIITKKEPLMNRTIHRFYLPNGIWYDYTTGKKFPGNKKYVSFFKEEDYPVFAKQGAIIPLSNQSNINNTSNPTELEIEIFPGKSNTYELYEDDGISSLYKEGFYLLTSIDYNYMPSNYTVIIRSIAGKSGIVPEFRSYKIRFKNTKKADQVTTYFDNGLAIPNKSYVEENDFIVEVNKVRSIGQLTINCIGRDIEIDAVRLVNDDIESILMDLQIETEMKEKIDAILFSNDPINKKRIAIRKLRRKGLDGSFVRLFLKLLEYIDQI